MLLRLSSIDLMFILNIYRPALGVLIKSVRLIAGRLGFYSQSGHTKTLKVVLAASCQALGTTGSAKCVVRLVCPLSVFNHS